MNEREGLKRIGKNTACFLNAVSEEPVFCIYKCQQYTVLNQKTIKSITFKFELSIVINLSNGFPISVFIDITSQGKLGIRYHFIFADTAGFR